MIDEKERKSGVSFIFIFYKQIVLCVYMLPIPVISRTGDINATVTATSWLISRATKITNHDARVRVTKQPISGDTCFAF